MWTQRKNCKNHVSAPALSNKLNCFESYNYKLRGLVFFLAFMAQGAVRQVNFQPANEYVQSYQSISTGSSFHHCGARKANSLDFVKQYVGPRHSEGVASRLAVAERTGRALVYGLTLSSSHLKKYHSFKTLTYGTLKDKIYFECLFLTGNFLLKRAT